MSRQDQALITVTVDGRALGTFDKRTGGASDSEEVKYRPGGMAPQRALGGPTMVANVVVERLCENERDHELARWATTRRGAPASVSEQPLDADGNRWGAPFVWHGILKTVTLPDRDSESNAAALWTMEISTEGAMT